MRALTDGFWFFLVVSMVLLFGLTVIYASFRWTVNTFRKNETPVFPAVKLRGRLRISIQALLVITGSVILPFFFIPGTSIIFSVTVSYFLSIGVFTVVNIGVLLSVVMIVEGSPDLSAKFASTNDFEFSLGYPVVNTLFSLMSILIFHDNLVMSLFYKSVPTLVFLPMVSVLLSHILTALFLYVEGSFISKFPFLYLVRWTTIGMACVHLLFLNSQAFICPGSAQNRCYRLNTRLDGFLTMVRKYACYLRETRWNFFMARMEKLKTKASGWLWEWNECQAEFRLRENRECRYCGKIIDDDNPPRKLVVSLDRHRRNGRNKEEYIIRKPAFPETPGQWDISEIRIDPKRASKASLEKLVTHMVNNPPRLGNKKVKVILNGSMEELGPGLSNLLRAHFKTIIEFKPQKEQ
jgi:hypothetical protein